MRVGVGRGSVGIVALVVEIGLAFFVFHVAEGVGFDIDLEKPALVVAEGHPAEAHLPAMEVAVDVDGGVGHALVDEIVAGGHGDFPVFGEADVAGEAEALDGLVLEGHLAGDEGVDVAEGVADGEVPGHREIDVAAGHEDGVVVVGRLKQMAHGLAAGLAAGGGEGVVVEAPGELCADGGVVTPEETVFLVPEEAVVDVAEGVDDVGREGGAIVEDEAAEERGAAGDGEVGPAERVASEVVGGGEIEVFDEDDLAHFGGGVEGVSDFDLEVVADGEAELSALSVGGAAVEALLEDGIAVDVAGAVGVLPPVAEAFGTEVGMVGEGEGGVDDVA